MVSLYKDTAMQPLTIGRFEVCRVEEMIRTSSPRFLFAQLTSADFEPYRHIAAGAGRRQRSTETKRLRVSMNNTMLLVSVLLLLGLSNLGHADIMRCETGRVVSSGDTTADVLSKCGEPTLQESRRECPKARHDKSHADKARAERHKSFRELDCVTVDIWTYDFGPRRLVQRLIFRNQRLDAIQTQGYGQ